MAMFFGKRKNVRILTLLSVENIDWKYRQDFSDVRILITKEHSPLN